MSTIERRLGAADTASLREMEIDFAKETPPAPPGVDPDGGEDLVGVYENAAVRYVDVKLRSSRTQQRWTMARKLAGGVQSDDVTHAIDQLHSASARLSDAVRALHEQVAFEAWQESPNNSVVAAKNIARGFDSLKQPVVPAMMDDRRVMVKSINEAASDLAALYEQHWPVLGNANRSDAYRVSHFMNSELQSRSSEATALVEADMMISASSPDPDLRQSQGQARAELKHRWRDNDGTKWRGSHRLSSYCSAVVDSVAARVAQQITFGDDDPMNGWFEHVARSSLDGLRLVKAVEPDVDAGAEAFPDLPEPIGAPLFTAQGHGIGRQADGNFGWFTL